MDVWAAAGERQRAHGDLINLSAGQPSTPAPRPVRTAAAAALERDVLGYTVALGLPELRAGVAAHYGHTYGLPVTVDDVIMTTGSSGGFLLAFLAAFDPGDRVAMASPGYPCYRNILTRWAARSSSSRAARRRATSPLWRCWRSSGASTA